MKLLATLLTAPSAHVAGALLYVVRPDGTGLRSLGIAGTYPAWRP